MKKIMLVLIGIVLGCTTCVIASNLMANNVTYTPNDSTWGVNNVEAAIDSLYVSKTSNNYSTDEKVVGTWIDGKPLYQKTYYLASMTNYGTSGTYYAVLDDFSQKILLNVFGRFVNSADNNVFTMPRQYGGSTDVTVFVYGATNELRMQNYNGYSAKDIYITVQYTKTTD